MDSAAPRSDRAEDQQDNRSTGAADDHDEHAGQTRRSAKSWAGYVRHRPWLKVAIALVLILIIVAGVLWWLHERRYESTDDAFIDTRTVTISPQISGAIADVGVTDNQVVEAGTVLVRIDDSIYQAQLAQATADVHEAQANIANLDAQLDAERARIDQANEQVEQARAALTFSQEEFARYQDLAKSGSGTVQQAQQARSDLLQKQASLAGAQASAVAEQKQYVVLQTQRSAADAQLESAQAQRTLANINLSHTVITAPVAGRITKLTAAKGAYVESGQALSMFVPLDIWVTANFKETQLAYMRPGQPVELRIDAFSDREFPGHVDSIQAGSGTAFSLLPAENATGNYVKVVQRVPVKITFDKPPDVEVGPGMSVVPTVTVR